jgi:flagellin FlaB
MRLRKLLKAKKGIVGIEAAIVLIAFVVIAAALSYVVINMGFFATQKTKDTIDQGIEESTSALQLDGTVNARTNGTGNITYLLAPVKLSVGRAEVDLSTGSVVVSVYLPDDTLLDIYQGSVSTTATDWDSLNTTLALAVDQAKFAIYNGDNDNVLESREKAFLMIRLGSDHTLEEYETAKIEVKTGRGAALTIERTTPGGLPNNSYVDLG